MVSRMPRFNGDERASTSGADFTARFQLGFDDCFSIRRFNDAGAQSYQVVSRSRSQKLDRIFGGDSAIGRVFVVLFH